MTYRFSSATASARPIWRGGRLQAVRRGNGRGQGRFLPRTGWIWLETIQNGGVDAIPVDVPATYVLDGRGVWYVIEQGVRGLLVPDERGRAVVYLICEPASRYYEVMTGSRRMPVLIDQGIRVSPSRVRVDLADAERLGDLLQGEMRRAVFRVLQAADVAPGEVGASLPSATGRSVGRSGV